jgi:ribonuclease P protein component
MRKESRLTKQAQFAAVFAGGDSWANRLLVLRARANGLGFSRFGFVVGKQVGKAVRRNKVKRWMRESVRLTPIKSGWDVVFIARSTCSTSDYHQVDKAIKELLSQACLLEESWRIER